MNSPSRESHSFVITPSTRALYVELIRGLLQSAAFLRIRVPNETDGESAILLASLTPHEVSRHAVRYGASTREFAMVDEVRRLMLELPDAFHSYPGDMALVRPDGSPILDSFCDHHAVRLTLGAEEYRAWRRAASVDLLACLDAPDPGRVAPLGPFLHATPDTVRLQHVLRDWTPIESLGIRDRVASYLESGILVVGGDDAIDVFDPERVIPGGDEVLTDGEWAWRREASHYVRAYGVGIAPRALARMTELDFVPPPVDEDRLDAISEFLWERYVDDAL